jgi:hypothetical protein
MKLRSASKTFQCGDAGRVAGQAGATRAIAGPAPEYQALCARERERRRQYNRNYMRRWRANPQHAQREGENRRRAYWRIKLSGADGADSVESRMSTTQKPQRNLCGFCGHRPSVTRISRLQISTPSAAFVPIEIPYCGQC